MSLDAATAGLIGAAIGGTSTVVTVAISSWLQRRSEHDKWIRDKKVEAYSNALRSIYRLKYRFSRVTAEGKPFLAKADQKEWFEDLASVIESLNLLPIFANKKFANDLVDKANKLQIDCDRFVRGQGGLDLLGPIDSLLDDIRKYAAFEFGVSEQRIKRELIQA